jgi:hypothetical protein
LAKFHTTIHLSNATPVEKLLEKVRAYLLTDKNTPVLGEFCRRVETLYSIKHNGLSIERSAKTARIERWNSHYGLNEQYPNENTDGWMDAYAESQLPNFDFAAFRLALVQCDHVEALMKMRCYEIDVPKQHEKSLVLEGDIVPGKTKAESAKPTTTVDKAKRKSKVNKVVKHKAKRAIKDNSLADPATKVVKASKSKRHVKRKVDNSKADPATKVVKASKSTAKPSYRKTAPKSRADGNKASGAKQATRGVARRR